MLLFTVCGFAQRDCGTTEYQQLLNEKDAEAVNRKAAIETFVQQQQNNRTTLVAGDDMQVIRIPVVVHVVYHSASENISDDEVRLQIAALNRDFQKTNADTTKIPSYFKSFAANSKFEFVLARSDARGRSTSGIIHNYTPVTIWQADDKVKFSSATGDDAWDRKSYLNIWVCTMPANLTGYATVPGDAANIDGVVISNRAFANGSGVYNKGRTAVHEIGHWLGLKHIWGDANCGDDLVDDTPQQRTYTTGCPSGIRKSCSVNTTGDMYMDYMDYVNDECMVMFSAGQVQRMRSLFNTGGARNTILSSKGLNDPVIEEAPGTETNPQWLHVKLFPNPSSNNITLDLEYDSRWIGKEASVYNATGIRVTTIKISSVYQKIDVSQLKPGVYFLKAEKDGDKIMEKFVKM